MNELMTKSLAQIVNSNHRAATVFEKYHLDFCCKGKRSLAQACAEKELEPNKVIADLLNTENIDSCAVKMNFEKLSLGQLADYIVMMHHVFAKKEMTVISGYLQKVASKHGDRHPEMKLVQENFSALKEEMEEHMQKEELILFPRIKHIEQLVAEGKELVLNGTYLLSPVNMLEQEHDHAGSLLAEIRKLTNNYDPPADACTTHRLSYAALQAFELDLHHHVHLENNILFPRALNLFGNTRQCSLN